MPSSIPKPGRSLADFHPELLTEWEYGKNDLLPTEVSAGSNQKVWWKCHVCGYEWRATIHNRSAEHGCPVCAGHVVMTGYNDLATMHPELVDEWDSERNGELLPTGVTAHSERKVWWRCRTCGHAWEAAIKNRSKEGGGGCPVCSGRAVAAGFNDLATVNPILAAEWSSEKNGDLRPTMVTMGSHKTVWWKCSMCGREWQATVNHRSSGHGCPRCANSGTSYPEQAIFFYVSKAFPDAHSRMKIKGMEADISVPSINTAIEYDGIVWHNGHEERDARKDEAFRAAGWRTVRVKETEGDSVWAEGSTVWCPLSDSRNRLDVTIRLTLALLGVTSADVDHERDSTAIQEQYRTYLRENSLAATCHELAAEWHPSKNGELTPEMFLSGSHSKAWWRCSTCGYEWRAEINSRSSGRGCPVCAGRIVLKGFNDLATLNPELAEEWDSGKNGELLPTMVTAHSGRRVWWRCRVCGHEWQATVQNRSKDSGCPECYRRRRSKK